MTENAGLFSKSDCPEDANIYRIPDLRFPIYIKNANQLKHGSDSESYDTEGRFVPVSRSAALHRNPEVDSLSTPLSLRKRFHACIHLYVAIIDHADSSAFEIIWNGNK